ncbi:hypothetical protein LCGC14_0852120 [marine sediment metagenome]|uniref:Uncharacterized protein n=1 Tax=marine sediment metagenome TaxID=412755 RepID=A0A0F9PEQ4_9ZZZZ
MPDPIPPPPEEEEEIELNDLAAFVGRSLLDLNTNFFGIVRTRTDRRTGRTVYWLSDPNTGRAQDLRTGATLVDPNTRAVTNISASSTGSAADSTVTSGGKLSEADVRRLFGEEEPGGSAPAFSSSQASQAQAEAFQREQDRLNREFQKQQDKLAIEARAEENRLAEEAALKRGRLSTLTDLIQSFVGAQSQARGILANLQPDAFKFAAVAGGIAPFGVTPQQGFTEQLQQFAGAPVPTADPNASLPSIESAIQGLTGAQVPLAPQTFGMAGGGTVPTPFATMTARMVGEKGPEVMVTGPQGVTILPLSKIMAKGGIVEMGKGADGSFSALPTPFGVATSQGVLPLSKGAQEGGFFPFEPIKFDKSSLFPALTTSGIFEKFDQPLPRTLPSENIFLPLSTRGPRGGFAAGRFGVPFEERGISMLEQFGIRPSLIRFGDENTVFSRNQAGQLERIADMDAFNKALFNTSDITRFAADQKGRFEFGSTFAGRDLSLDRASQFTPFSQPIIEPTTGTILPAPFMVASEMNKLRLTNPGAFNLLLSAYESAGVPAMSVLSTVQAALPFGAERGTIGLR